jgi:hypothetical protein
MSFTYRHILALTGLLFMRVYCNAQFHTNTITTPGGIFSFSVDGVANNPTINLTAGVTNILQINTSSFHPVVVATAPSKALATWYNGAAPQNINSGPIALNTPGTGFPAKLYYVCSVHGFFGEIDLTGLAGPVPPPNLILSVLVGTNVVMKSTGTNTTWLLIPEYNSNLLNATWASVPSYTNTFANGTNTTVFDRLDPICGPNVFLRLRQQEN